MATITITELPGSGSVLDTTLFASDSSVGVTQNVTGSQLKNYMTALPVLTVAGGITGTLVTASQPQIRTLGNLTGIITNGLIESTVATGLAPIQVQSTTMVGNLYVARANVADVATNGLTTSTSFISAFTSDATITGTYNTLSLTLKNVNSTPGTWGGNDGTTYYIPKIVINAKGQITSAANIAVDLNLTSRAVTNLTGTDNQITASGSVGTVTLSLPSQVNITNLSASGTASAAALVGATVTDAGNRVLTGITVTAGTGLSGGGAISGPTGSVTLNNTGILSVTAGTGISVSAGQNPTITNTGVTGLAGSSGISVSAATGGITVSPTWGYNGYGTRTISTGTPSGGNDGDIWYQV